MARKGCFGFLQNECFDALKRGFFENPPKASFTGAKGYPLKALF
jgi:hypothetical protein